jgi:hypothetical protein
LQSRKQVQALLAQARQIAPNAAKGNGTRLGVKATRDFLLDLHHPKITLSLIVRKWIGIPGDAIWYDLTLD